MLRFARDLVGGELGGEKRRGWWELRGVSMRADGRSILAIVQLSKKVLLVGYAVMHTSGVSRWNAIFH